jgi:hypothetical protein
MVNRERRKQKKIKLRLERLRQKNEHKRVQEVRMKRRAEYPEIILQGSGKHSVFLKYLKESISKVDFSNSTFSRIERHYYKVFKKEGAKVAEEFLIGLMDAMPKKIAHQKNWLYVMTVNNLGEQIFAGIPTEVRRQYLPFVNCQIKLRDTKIILAYEEIESFSSDVARFYSSQIKPIIRFRNRDFRVGFVDHAIKRISTRIKREQDCISYSGAGDLYGYFARCVYFEPMELYGNQPAFSMWDYAYMPGLLQYDVYVKEVLGEDNVNWNGGVPYYRLGYCPIVFENGFAVAKTFLLPGFKNTPEYSLLLSSSKSNQQETKRIITLAEKIETHDMLVSGQVDHIKWFHNNGIPQVKQIDHEVFRYHHPPRTLISDFPQLVERKRELESSD